MIESHKEGIQKLLDGYMLSYMGNSYVYDEEEEEFMVKVKCGSKWLPVNVNLYNFEECEVVK